MPSPDDMMDQQDVQDVSEDMPIQPRVAPNYLDDMPGLQALFNTLMSQKEAIEEALAPIRAEYDGLQEEMTPLIERQRELGAQIKTIIAERNLGAIQNQLSAIARASGGRSTSQSA